MTEAERLEQRAFDAVSRCLIRYLTVPNIYFEANWPEKSDRADIVAIDRAGSGDIHLLELKYHYKDAVDHIPRLLSKPAQFKWIAFFRETVASQDINALYQCLVPPAGMGRVGAIEIVQMSGGDLGANVVVNPERFAGSFREQITSFLHSNQPDISADNLSEAELAPSPYVEPDLSLIHSRLAEVEPLSHSGHVDAAFLIAWSVVEAVLRMIAVKESLWIERESPGATIRSLHSYGILNDTDFKLLMDALRIRNALGHGYQSANSANLSTLELMNITAKLLSQIESSQRV